MGAGSCLMKTILILFNSIFLILGIAMMGGGIAVFVMGKEVQKIIDPMIADIADALDELPLADSTGTATTQETVDIIALMKPLAIGFIALGVFLFITACAGCCGACCTVKPLLIAYAIVLFLFVFIEALLLGLLWTEKLNGPVRDQLTKSLKKYRGLKSLDSDSLIWSVLMFLLNCCGLDGYKDFEHSPDWPKKIQITVGGTVYERDMLTPFACCKMEGAFPNFDPKDQMCANIPTELNNYMNVGCWGKVWDNILKYKTYVIVGFVVLMAVEAILAIMAILIICSADSKISP